MRRWAILGSVAAVTCGFGLLVILATALADHAWAWVAVALLTVGATGLAPLLAQPPGAGGTGNNGRTVSERARTTNDISGDVTGQAIQAGKISGSVNLADQHIQVTQQATATGNSSIRQAGRDITDYHRP